MVKSILFLKYLAKISFNQKMTPSSSRWLFVNFGRFFECFSCIKVRWRRGRCLKFLGKWKNMGFGSC